MIKRFRNILEFFKKALSFEEGLIKGIVSLLFVMTGALFFYTQIFASFIPGIMMIAWLFVKDPPRAFLRNYYQSGVWLFLLVFLAYAGSVIWSADKAHSLSILETKLLLPILPLLLVKQWKPSPKLVHLMFMGLTISFMILLTLLWISMIQKYSAGHTDHWRLQHSWYLSRKYGLHHGDYAIIGLFIPVYFATRLYQTKSRSLSFIPVILFWSLIVFTGSDIVRVISGVILITFVIDIAWKGFRKAFPIIYVVALSTILTISFSISDSKGGESHDSYRLMIWPSSVELIKEKPLFGLGIGDVQKELNAKYLEHGFDKPLEEGYNSHNQFLDIALSSGLIGLGTLLALLISIAFRTSRNNNLYGILFLITITLALSVENLLSRLDGIIIVCFFYAVFNSLSGYLSKPYDVNKISPA